MLASFGVENAAGAAMVIGEKYELLHMLGRGSTGEVWLARHNTLFENVAIKLLTSRRLPGRAQGRIGHAQPHVFASKHESQLTSLARRATSFR